MESMEGLRGLAVILVFLVHFSGLAFDWIYSGSGERLVESGRCTSPSSTFTSVLACSIGNMGNIGVDLFFVLSGFLIYGGLMRRKQPYGEFMRRRIQRIYPTYLVVLGVYVVMALALPSQDKISRNPLEALVTIVINVLLLPGFIATDAIMTVSWTLSFELFFYLTVPLLIDGLHLRDRVSRWRVRTFVLMGLVFAIFGGLTSGSHARMAMFFSGMILWEWVESRSEAMTSTVDGGRKLDRLGLAALGAALLGSMVLLSMVMAGTPRLFLLMFAWPTVCAACFCVEGRTRRIFSVTPLRWLGNMSYSFYLVHGLVLLLSFEALRLVLPPNGHQSWVWWVLCLPFFILSVVVSFVLFVVIEQRFSLKRA